MLTVEKGGRSMKFIWKNKYELRDVPKKAGFFWDPIDRVWYTRNLEVAKRIPEEYWTNSFREYLNSSSVKEETLATRENRKISLKVPEGFSLFPYQEEGAKRILLSRGLLLADEMGLGKTVQVLVAIASDPRANRVLIVCPNSVKYNWLREATRWIKPIRDLPIVVLSGTRVDEEVAREVLGDQVISIINYDIVSSWSNVLRKREWDYLVLDEAHYVKNTKAKRTLAIFGEKNKNPIPSRKKIAMTGTPIVNRPVEAWTFLSWIDPRNFGSFWSYAKRYCGAHYNGWGWDFRGATNLEELNAKLRPIMLRRRKEEVLKDLPDKIRQVLEIPPNGAKQVLEEERRVLLQMEEEIAKARALVELAKVGAGDLDLSEAMANLRRVVQIAFQHISLARHKTALAKVPYALDHIKDVLEEKPKVVVWVHHRDVAEAIREGLSEYNPLLILGGMGAEERQKAVEAFQNNPEHRVVICSIGAAAEGITLTAADIAVFVELDWRPSKLSQAEDRIHRIGQKNSVLIQYLVFNGSIDANIANSVAQKIRVISKAMDGSQEEEGAMVLSVFGQEEEQEQAYPEQPEQEVPGEVKEFVLRALRHLAENDLDRARLRNGVGFNAMDSYIGHALANLPSLTDRQALLGLKLVRKYRRQLAELIDGASEEVKSWLSK